MTPACKLHGPAMTASLQNPTICEFGLVAQITHLAQRTPCLSARRLTLGSPRAPYFRPRTSCVHVSSGKRRTLQFKLGRAVNLPADVAGKKLRQLSGNRWVGSPVWRHLNDPGRFRNTSFGFEPEGHQERRRQGPCAQPQVECFTCQACRTALQPLGLPMQLQARFPAILTPQEIGCRWTLGLGSTSCRNLHYTFFGSPFSASGSYSGLVQIVVGRAVVSCLLWL